MRFCIFNKLTIANRVGRGTEVPGRSNMCFPVFHSNPSLPGGVFSLQIVHPSPCANGARYPTQPPGYGSDPYQSEAAVETSDSAIELNCELGAEGE